MNRPGGDAGCLVATRSCVVAHTRAASKPTSISIFWVTLAAQRCQCVDGVRVSRYKPPAAAPRTKKGRSTKQALLLAGRRVFGRDGYAAARVSDIAAEAGLSNGAFYWYYRGKRDVLIELLTGTLADLLEDARSPWLAEHPSESVRITTERYLRFYEANADIFRLLHETVQTDPEVEAMQAATRCRFHERIANMIRRGMELGVLRPTLDPELSTALLGGMTEHYAFTRFVLRRHPDQDIGSVSSELAELWDRATQVDGASSYHPRVGP